MLFSEYNCQAPLTSPSAGPREEGGGQGVAGRDVAPQEEERPPDLSDDEDVLILLCQFKEKTEITN